MTPRHEIDKIRKKLQEELGILRGEMNYHQLQVRSGVDRANMRPIFTGKVGCSLQTAIALSHALGYELKLVKREGGDE